LVSNIDPDEEFITEVIAVIQGTLTEKFGADVTKVILFNFQNSTNSKREDIVRKPEKFEAFLDSMFGNGSRIMRKLIIKSLDEHFKIENERRNVELGSTILAAWKMKQSLSG
jgi:hypothetical protein